MRISEEHYTTKTLQDDHEIIATERHSKLFQVCKEYGVDIFKTYNMESQEIYAYVTEDIEKYKEATKEYAPIDMTDPEVEVNVLDNYIVVTNTEDVMIYSNENADRRKYAIVKEIIDEERLYTGDGDYLGTRLNIDEIPDEDIEELKPYILASKI